jgi:uncharacterized membrane protein YoaK (UPF0700 family)
MDSAGISGAIRGWLRPANDAVALSRLEERLPPLLSVIAGMVDLTGFFTLGNIFTAHITGNLVVAAAVAVRGGPLNPAQLLAIPVFILALMAVWLLARLSGWRGSRLARLLLLAQFLLLATVLGLAVGGRLSSQPHGALAGIAVMVAVAAMACQFALFRLAIPAAISTAVMTGNLTNTVLSLMDRLSPNGGEAAADAARLRRSLHLLLGFLAGCVLAAAAISLMADWAWSLPVVLAGLAMLLR